MNIAPLPADPFPALAAAVRAAAIPIIVLDDDPTGTQTVHDVPVLTRWTAQTLAAELQPNSVIYLLTNSRSLSRADAQALAERVGREIRQAEQISKQRTVIISRSDSTLRGHYPAETDALAVGYGKAFDALVLAPFFLEGGRLTIDDVHYVDDGTQLTPVGQTAFARDATFGYQHSNLRQWIEERTGGQIAAVHVHAVTLADIRLGGPDVVAARLRATPPGGVCIINAVARADIEIAAHGALIAEQAGWRALYRTAASFVAARAAIAPRPLVTAADLTLAPGGGLIIVGSYVPLTAAQVARLCAERAITPVEVPVNAVLSGQFDWAPIAARLDAQLRAGQDALLLTSRTLVTGADAEASLGIGRQVSAALTAIIRAMSVRPRFIIAKGGITSADTATHGLGATRAVVRGQILPGVPVWELGAESRFPGVPYIVFPGNVGDTGALARVVDMLRK